MPLGTGYKEECHPQTRRVGQEYALGKVHLGKNELTAEERRNSSERGGSTSFYISTGVGTPCIQCQFELLLSAFLTTGGPLPNLPEKCQGISEKRAFMLTGRQHLGDLLQFVV